MATNEQIKLDIVSGFDPGGFAKANNAVRGLGSEMKKGAKVTDNLITAFGQADGVMGQMAGTVSKLGAAFKGGGLIALAAAGVALIVSKFIEAREAAAKLAEEQKKTWREDLIKRAESMLSNLVAKHSQIADEIERGAKAAEKIAKAYEALAKSEISVENAAADKIVAQLEGGKQSALSAETDPVKRKAIELDYEMQIFEAKKASAKFERDQKAWVAAENVLNAQSALNSEKDKLSALQSRAAELSDFMANNTGSAKLGEYNKAKVDLAKTNTDITQSQTNIRDRELALSGAKNERTATRDQNDAAVTREAIQQTALSEKQIQFDKAQEEYQKALDKRTKVEDRITKQEEKIEKLKDREKDREEKRKNWNQNAAQAQALGAAGWNQQQMDAADAQEQLGKDNKREAKWVDEAKKRIARGTKLGPDDMKRLANFDDWKKLQGPNPFDPGQAAADQLKAMNENLKEIKLMRESLDQSLRVN